MPTPSKFRRINVVPAYRKVADAIEREIVNGRIKPGEAIGSENELVIQFGLNRSTIREGLRILQENGFVHRKAGRRLHAALPGRGRLTSQVTRALILEEVTFRELYEATVVLETASICAAADCAKEHDIERLRQNLTRAAKSTSDVSAFLERDCEFHDIIASASGNRVLQLSREPIVRLFYPVTELIVGNSRAGMLQILEAHRKLLAAIADRDKETAVLWTYKHLRAWKRAFEKIGSPDQPVEAVYLKYKADRDDLT